MEKLLTTPQASDFLLLRFGISRRPSTLSRLRVQGGGPRFKKLNRAVLYEPEALERWANERLSPPRLSTSDRGDGRPCAPGVGSDDAAP